MSEPRLRIGTRGSPLALAQADIAARALVMAHPDLPAPEIVAIRTTGDRVVDRPLAEVGGKGLFTKEIEAALLAGRIDLAVHSMKDVETWLPDGLVIDCVLARADPRDALIGAADLAALAPGAVVGTASLRRAAQLRAHRPDLEIAPLRGNVDTRLAKVARGEVDATLLAVAGLDRLGRAAAIGGALDPAVMLPAVAQGAIGIERRADDDRIAALLAPLNDGAAQTCVTAERAMLAALDGSCRTPIAALATLDGDALALDGLIVLPDGSARHAVRRDGAAGDAAELGADAGAALRAAGGPGFFAGLG